MYNERRGKGLKYNDSNNNNNNNNNNNSNSKGCLISVLTWC